MKDLNNLAYNSGVMPILFVDDEICIDRVISAIEQTEMPVVEILQRGDFAKDALIKAAKIKKNALIGAGTVCSLEHCKEMVDLGADFIVSPGYNPEMVDWCAKNNVTVIPGVSSTSEIMMAVNHGYTLLKAFPFHDLGGTKFFEAISGPFADVRFVATGFMSDKNLSLLSSPKIASITSVLIGFKKFYENTRFFMPYMFHTATQALVSK